MVSAIVSKQIIIQVDNEVGTLAQITNLISDCGINLVAICAYAINKKGFIAFVSENNIKAKRLLKEKGYSAKDEDVIVLTIDNKPGALRSVTEKIARVGVDITLIYGTVEKKDRTSRLILVTEDNNSALAAIRLK